MKTKILDILRNTFSTYIYFYRYLGYRIFITLLLSILVGALDGLGLSMFIPLLEVAGNSEPAEYGSMGYMSFIYEVMEGVGLQLTLSTFLSIMVVFFVLKGFFVYYSSYYQVMILNMFIRKQRLDVLEKLVDLDYKSFIQADAGRIQNTLSAEVDRVAQGASSYFRTIQQGVLVLVYVGFAFVIDAQFALLVSIGGVLTNFLYQIVYRYTVGESRLLTSNNSMYQGQVVQFVLNFKYLKATAVVYRFKEIMTKTIFMIENNRRKMGVLNSLLTGAREPILIAVIAIIIYIQVELIGAALGGILISLVFFYRALSALTQMQTTWNAYLSVAGSMENMQSFQNEMQQGIEALGPVDQAIFKNKIQCKQAFFKYGHDYVLKDINITIAKNSTVAFVGESGSGKTTLINVLSSLLSFTEGDLYVDDSNIRNLSKVSYRKKIGYITQEPVIFTDTIFNNITLWSEPTKESIDNFRMVCQQASILDFIESLDDKEFTFLGNNGINLSGGQKQRISIARELFKGCEILIFDEATSALDSQTEKQIQDNIFELKGRYTVIMIAHRLSTIKNADQIYYLKEGKIVAHGNFDELVANSDDFRKSVQLN